MNNFNKSIFRRFATPWCSCDVHVMRHRSFVIFLSVGLSLFVSFVNVLIGDVCMILISVTLSYRNTTLLACIVNCYAAIKHERPRTSTSTSNRRSLVCFFSPNKSLSVIGHATIRTFGADTGSTVYASLRSSSLIPIWFVGKTTVVWWQLKVRTNYENYFSL